VRGENMNDNSEQVSFSKILCDHYGHNIDIYKFYLSIIIQMNLFYYGITGAILSFYFLHSEISYLKYSLLLPIIFSVGLIAIFISGISKSKVLNNDTKEIACKLNLDTFHDLDTLKYVLILFSILHFFVVSMLVFFIFYDLQSLIPATK
jgi:hypothetical protein